MVNRACRKVPHSLRRRPSPNPFSQGGMVLLSGLQARPFVIAQFIQRTAPACFTSLRHTLFTASSFDGIRPELFRRRLNDGSNITITHTLGFRLARFQLPDLFTEADQACSHDSSGCFTRQRSRFPIARFTTVMKPILVGLVLVKFCAGLVRLAPETAFGFCLGHGVHRNHSRIIEVHPDAIR